jgi:transposase
MMFNGEPVTNGITEGVEARKQRGLEIAAKMKVVRRPDGDWTVPSTVGIKKYTVCIKHRHCTCPDHEIRRCDCKHIHAVRYVMEQESHADGSETVREELTVVSRPSYPQNWPAYNAAQTCEKAKFQVLLRDLCATIDEPEQQMGRPRLPLRDQVFSAAFKVYSTVSGRRFTCDLSEAHAKGYISRLPRYNAVFDYFGNKSLTPVLLGLIEQSSLPLVAVESDFAVDATGFGSSRFAKWFNFKYGQERIAKDWVKLHLMCGVKTNIVTSVHISGRFEHDMKFLPGLVNRTAENFQIAEVSADKGYHSRDCYHAINAVGAQAFIPFKTTSKTEYRSRDSRKAMDTLWNKMYHLYHLKREEFLPHYHKRSNVESTFMAIKAKFGDAVRSRSTVAQANEVLCKVLGHNICVLIQSIYELGIQPEFGAN